MIQVICNKLTYECGGQRVVLSRHTIRCMRIKAKRCEKLTEEDIMYHMAAGARANVTQCENEIRRDNV